MITRTHRAAGVLAVLALTAPMAATMLAATSSPAFAASGSINTPVSNGVYTDGATSVPADASGTFNSGESVKLATTDGPTGTDLSQNASATNCTSSLTRNCAGRPWKLSYNVGISPSRPNGKITLTLTGPGLSTTRSFYTNFKPTADPANLAAATTGRTQVDLSWSYSGSEPDKAGFEIVETHNGSSRTITAPASACSGSSCGYALTYPEPAEATTEDYSYTVTALRSSGGCGSCGDYTRSDASPSASAQLVGPPPPPSPTPTPSQSSGGTTGSTPGTTTGGTTGSTTGSTGSTSGGSTGSTPGSTSGSTTGSTGGSTSGTSTGGSGSSGTTQGSVAKPIVIPTLPPLVASRRAFALGFNRFSPSLGIPKLPPLPATTFPVTAPDEGTYQPTLPYGAEPRTTTKVLSSPIAQIGESLDLKRLAPPLAVALILLVAAAHVRIFLSHSAED